MSRVIDEKVVSMQFENNDFEKDVDSSIRCIKGLQSSLNNLEGSTGGLNSIGNALNEVEVKFNTMQFVVANVLSNIVNGFINTGTQLVKSLSIDQVTEGYAKFEQKTTSVQTILNAVKKDGEDEVEALKRVNAELDKLNWFTDETSYSLTDMTSNIGKFTSQGVDLETAVTAMEGISTWAAVSGQSATEASRAMYNLAQALSAGSVKVKDWMSIENANMATEEFKNTAIQTAIALGELSENTTIDSKNFRDSLQDGWLTNEVLLATLNKYGGFTDKLYEFQNELYDTYGEEVTATKFQQYLSEYVAGSLDLDEALAGTTIDANRFTEMLQELSEDTYSLGKKAFRAAQEAKTFSEAIKSVKDAVSTNFMNIFESVFGNYLEAKNLWTDVANWLWDIFAAPISNLSDVFKSWNEKGGQKGFVQGLYNLMDSITNILEAFSSVWESVFGSLDETKLIEITGSFLRWTSDLKSGSENLDVFKSILTKVLSIVKIAIDVLKNAIKVFSPVFKLIKDIVGFAINKLSGASGLSNSLQEASESISNAFVGIYKSVYSFTVKIKKYLLNAYDIISGLVSQIKLSLKLQFLELNFSNTSASLLDKVKIIFKTILNILTGDGVSIASIIKAIIAPLKSAFGLVKSLIGAVVPIINAALPVLSKLSSLLSGIIVSGLNKLSDVLDRLDANSLLEFIKKGAFTYLVVRLASSVGSIGWVFDELGETLSSFKKLNIAKLLVTVATSLFVLAGALVLISSIPTEKLSSSMLAITGLISELGLFMVSLSKIITPKDTKAIISSSKAFVKIGIAILALSVAMKMIASLDEKAIEMSLSAISVMMLELLLLSNSVKKGINSKTISSFIAVSLAIINLSLAVAILGRMKTETLIKGTLAVAALVGIIGIFTKLINSVKVSAGAIATILTIGVAIAGLAIAMKVLSGIETTQMIVIASVVSAMLGVIVGALAILQIISGKTFSAGALVLIGIAFIELASAIKIISDIDWKQALVAVGSMAAVLAVAVGALAVMQMIPGKIGSAASLIVMGIALNIFAKSFVTLSKLNIKQVGIGLLALAGALAIIGVAAFALKAAVPTMFALSGVLLILSASFSLAGSGMLAFATALSILSELTAEDSENIKNSLAALGEGLAILAKTTLGSLWEIIKTWIEVKFKTIFEIIAQALIALPSIVIRMVANLISVLKESISSIAQDLIAIVTTIIQVLAENINPIIDGLMIIVMSILDALVNKIGPITDKLLNMLIGIIETIGNKIQPLIESVLNLIIKIFDGVAGALDNKSSALWSSLWNMVVSILKAILKGIFSLDALLKNIGRTIWNMIVSGVRSMFSSIKDFVGEIINKIKEAITSKVNKIKEIGMQLLEGIKKGIKEKWNTIIESVSGFGRTVLDALKNIFDINSPSKETQEMGEYLVLGLTKGINKYENKAKEAATELGKTTTQGLNAAIASAIDSVNDDLNNDMIITPVLDLSEIQNGASRIGSMIGNGYSYKLAGQVSSISTPKSAEVENETLTALRDLANSINNLTETGDTFENTFNITGDDPKAIAETVADMLQRQVNRRKVVWS